MNGRRRRYLPKGVSFPCEEMDHEWLRGVDAELNGCPQPVARLPHAGGGGTRESGPVGMISSPRCGPIELGCAPASGLSPALAAPGTASTAPNAIGVPPCPETGERGVDFKPSHPAFPDTLRQPVPLETCPRAFA